MVAEKRMPWSPARSTVSTGTDFSAGTGSHAIDWSVLPPPLVELFRTGTALQLAWLSTLADRTRRFLDKMPRM
jgi:hypothetical protein